MKSTIKTTRGTQVGAATLVVVMMLFLVMALLAAYANRSVLFEQRMSVGYGRASLAQEAAEAGIEWTLAQLNGTAVDSACKPVAQGGQRFVDRYLQLDSANRVVNRLDTGQVGLVDCAKNLTTGDWSCRCPAPDAARTAAPAVSGPPTSSFLIRLGLNQRIGDSYQSRPRAGTVQLDVIGCTDGVVDKCLLYNDANKSFNGRSTASLLLGLVGAVRNPPAAPLVVRQDLETSGSQGLGLHNSDPESGGMLAIVGGAWTPSSNSRLDSIPGTPVNQTVSTNDLTFKNMEVDGVFKKFMGASVARYQSHPALRKVTCTGECSVAIDNAIKAGKRILWIDGPLTIDSSKTFGSATSPVVLIATGAAQLSGSFRFYGMLVTNDDLQWVSSGASPATVFGTVMVGGRMVAAGGMDIVYQQTIINQLRNSLGSYVRVPGSWGDQGNI